MTDEQKQDFTLRISQANKSALVVILYDIFLTYAGEAEAASPADGTFHIAISKARGALRELIDSLHLDYEIAQSTYQIYRFVERELICADVRRDAAPIAATIRIMRQLRDAYAEAAKYTGPMLIIHGDADRTVNVSYGKAAAESYQNARLEVLPGEDHGFSGKADFLRSVMIFS